MERKKCWSQSFYEYLTALRIPTLNQAFPSQTLAWSLGATSTPKGQPQGPKLLHSPGWVVPVPPTLSVIAAPQAAAPQTQLQE